MIGKKTTIRILSVLLALSPCYSLRTKAQSTDPKFQANLDAYKAKGEEIKKKTAEWSSLFQAGKYDEAAQKQKEIDKASKEFKTQGDAMVNPIMHDLNGLQAQAASDASKRLVGLSQDLNKVKKTNPNSLEEADLLHSIALTQAVAGQPAASTASYKESLRIFAMTAKTKKDKQDYYRCMRNYYDTLTRTPGSESDAKALLKPLNDLYQSSK